MPKSKASHVWERGDLDWYQEPESSTDQLLRAESFDGPILDPCCGGGNTVRSVIRTGQIGVGTDLTTRAGAAGQPWFKGERDFLTMAVAGNIIMNPPFFRAKGTEAFTRHALKIARGKVCVFTDIKFLAGSGRANGLYAEHPPSRVWIITPRPSCPPGAYLEAGNEAGGGTADWVWLVWDADRAGDTRLNWLRGAA